MNTTWLGLDIGGANLKSWCDGIARSRPFELWKNPAGLAGELGLVHRELRNVAGIAVTMTGELCDCFQSREQGVRQIITAVQQAFSGRQILVYQLDGNLVPPDEAIDSWSLTAAANWHAIASAAMQFVPDQSGFLIDIGSTTTDVIPFCDGKVLARGKTDFERLANGELVYTGVQRSPVCAVARGVTVAGQTVSLAQEWFANMQDVYVVLDLIENPDCLGDTPDGRPPDEAHSIARLARSVCSDVGELGREAVVDLARQIADVHQMEIRSGIQKVMASHPNIANRVLVAGQGEWLANRLAGQLVPAPEVWWLSTLAGRETSRCAAAWAVSCLAEKFCGVVA